MARCSVFGSDSDCEQTHSMDVAAADDITQLQIGTTLKTPLWKLVMGGARNLEKLGLPLFNSNISKTACANEFALALFPQPPNEA